MVRKSSAKRSARKSASKKRSGPRVLQRGPRGGRYLEKRKSAKHSASKRYVKQCKGSARKNTNSQKRVVHVGPRGGEYCIVGGKKRYL